MLRLACFDVTPFYTAARRLPCPLIFLGAAQRVIACELSDKKLAERTPIDKVISPRDKGTQALF